MKVKVIREEPAPVRLPPIREVVITLSPDDAQRVLNMLVLNNLGLGNFPTSARLLEHLKEALK